MEKVIFSLQKYLKKKDRKQMISGWIIFGKNFFFEDSYFFFPECFSTQKQVLEGLTNITNKMHIPKYDWNFVRKKLYDSEKKFGQKLEKTHRIEGE